MPFEAFGVLFSLVLSKKKKLQLKNINYYQCSHHTVKAKEKDFLHTSFSSYLLKEIGNETPNYLSTKDEIPINMIGHDRKIINVSTITFSKISFNISRVVKCNIFKKMMKSYHINFPGHSMEKSIQFI
jgi:hypothetical protein